VTGGAARRPPFIGLTGGIAAGKSEVLSALERLGAQTLSTDAVVHELLASAELRDRLVERWGSDVAPDGVTDRSRIASVVFGDRDELAWLEAELHPRVGERIAAWGAGLPPGTELAVVEVPLLFETGMDGGFDATLAVVADDRVRAERAGKAGLSSFEGRGSRQLSQEEKADRATYVIRNDGCVDDLRRAVEELWPRLAATGVRAT
jgi:dephospho-CoA kinase